jgi:pyrophosphatase PpaX
VTFDLDGTLLDTRDFFVRAHRGAARDVLGADLDEELVLELMAGGTPLYARMAVIGGDAAPRLADAFLERYRRERPAVRPFDGIADLLARLRGFGLRLAVVSSKLRDDVLVELAGTGLDRHVDAVVAFEDTTDHKPAPDPQLRALRLLGADGGVGVGDVASDVASAVAAGLDALGVGWGYGSAESLLAAGAAHVCESVEELERELSRRLRSPLARL